MARTLYACGFLFDEYGNVALIKKNRPEFMAGKYNGIGGHIEDGETPEQAMRREFREEAGVDIPEEHWTLYAILKSDEAIYSQDEGYAVYFFQSHGNHKLRSLTDEPVAWVSLNDVVRCNRTMSNLPWLVTMALYENSELMVIHDNTTAPGLDLEADMSGALDVDDFWLEEVLREDKTQDPA